MESFFLFKRGILPRLLPHFLGNGNLRLSSLVVVLFCLIQLFGTIRSYSSETEFFVVPPVAFSSDYFPCSECHKDLEANPEKRNLHQHTEIVYKDHAEDERWCLDCHDPADRDKLLLTTGEKVGFDASHKICWQCHGSLHNDWQHGIHGKRIGNWDGRKQYYLCAACHNPHTPAFRPITPEPPPVAPEKTLKRRDK